MATGGAELEPLRGMSDREDDATAEKDDAGRCWLCGRTIERGEEGKRLPTLGVSVHSHCFKLDADPTLRPPKD